MGKRSEIFQRPPIDCGANRDYFMQLANEYDIAMLRFDAGGESICRCRTDGRGTLVKEIESVGDDEHPALRALLDGKSMRLRYGRERFRRSWVEGAATGLCAFRGGLRQAILDLRAAAALAIGAEVEPAVRAAVQAYAESRNFEGGTAAKEDLAQMYSDFLRQEGYAPQIDEDGDVVFREEKRTFVIIADENDPQFFRLLFPNFWPIESEEERQRAREAADQVNTKVKVVKFYLQRDNVCAAIEAFFTSPLNFKGVFRRMMAAINAGVQEFASIMRQG